MSTGFDESGVDNQYHDEGHDIEKFVDSPQSSLSKGRDYPEYTRAGGLDGKESVSESKDFSNLYGVERARILYDQNSNVFIGFIIWFTAFLVGFAYSLDAQVRSTYTTFALNNMNAANLYATIQVVTAIIGAAGQLGYARLADVFGRLELYAFAVLCYVVGTIIQCQATNVARYATGAVFYNLGYVGVILVLLITLSDLSATKWRLFYILAPTFPFIAITWFYGNVADDVGTNHWKWGIGMWAFIFPIANIPFFCTMAYLHWKASRTEQWKNAPKGLRRKAIKERGIWTFLKFIFWKVDILGLFLMTVMLGCILTPLTLAGGVKSKWQQASFIVPIVIGVVLIPVLALYLRFISRTELIPFSFFKNRGVYPALIISFFFMFVYMVCSEYLYAILIVSFNESIPSASRISSLGNFVGELVGFFLGLSLPFFRRLKPFIAFGTSMWFVALGLMFHFRAGLNSHSGIIAAECMMGFGTGFFSYPITVVMQSNVKHEYLARVTALGYTFYRVGGAVGSSVGGAIWNQLLYKRLLKHTTPTIATEALLDYYTFIAKYPWGTSERADVVEGYKYIQKILITVAICFNAIIFLSALILKDRKLTNNQSIEDDDSEDLEGDEEFNPLIWIKNKIQKKD